MRVLASLLLILAAGATAFVLLRQHGASALPGSSAEAAVPAGALPPTVTTSRTARGAEPTATSASRPETTRHPRVVGRLVLAGGTPVANASVSRQLVAENPAFPERNLGGIWVKTDADGNFHFEQIGAPEPPWRWRYEFEHDLDRDRVRRARGSVAFPVDRSSASERNLGTILLVADPELVLLASGTIRGVVEADLKRVSLVLGRYPPGQGYVPLRCVVERDGARFRLLGHPCDGVIEFAASANGSLRFARAGAVAELQDLDVVLTRGRTMRGRIEIAPELVAAAREAGTSLLYLQVEDASGRHLRSFELYASGPLSLAPLPEEPVHVQVRSQVGGWVLAEVRDVRANDDPRLDPLRIEPPCRLARLRFVTGDGAALAGVPVDFAIQPGTGRAMARTDGSGRVVLALPASARRLMARTESGAELECPIGTLERDVVVR